MILRLACLLTTSDYAMLQQESHSSRVKVIKQSCLLLIPSIIWAVIGFNIADTYLQQGFVGAALIGLVLSLFILWIDRLIFMSVNNGVIIIIRLLLALTMTLLGSIFLDELLFYNDIKEKLIVNSRRDIIHQYSDVLEKYTQDIDEAKKDFKEKNDDFKEELNGQSPTHTVGMGDVAKQKKRLMEGAGKHRDHVIARYDSLLNKIDKQVQADEADIRSGQKIKGIIASTRALFEVVWGSWSALFIYILVSLLLCFFESMALIGKYSLAETSYEKRVKLADATRKQQLERAADIWLKQAQINQHFRVNQEQNKQLKLNSGGIYRY